MATCKVQLLAPADERSIATFFCPRRDVVFSRQVLPGAREARVQCDHCPIPVEDDQG